MPKPRTGTYAVIVRDGEILLIQHTRGPYVGRWDLPGGAIDRGETISDGLIRECREELGANITVGPLLTVVEALPLHKDEAKHLIGIIHSATLNSEPRTGGNNDDIAAVRWWRLRELQQTMLGGMAWQTLSELGLIGARATEPGCFSCENTARGGELPPRERIYDDGLWRVAHSFNSALPGWLVVLPQRHVTSLAELTPAEADALGPLLRDLSAALAHVVGCTKTYVMLFAEAEGFHHLHIHLVPRMPDLPDKLKGPRIFGYLKHPEAEWVATAEMDRIGAALAEQLKIDKTAQESA